MTPRIHFLFAGVTSMVMAVAVAWGFYLVGSPNTRRIERIDEQRLRDLQMIAEEIQQMVVDPEHPTSLKAPLPQTLQEAADRATNRKLNLNDPETGEPYLYKVTSESSYELCATFRKAREIDYSIFWNHPAGAHCFKIHVLDPPPFW